MLYTSHAKEHKKNFSSLEIMLLLIFKKMKKIFAKSIRIFSYDYAAYADFLKIKYAAAAESISNIETTQELLPSST